MIGETTLFRTPASRGSAVPCILAAALALGMSVMAGILPGAGGAAQAQGGRPSVERVGIEALPGRWKSRATGQSVDLVRCGEGWCGIRVDEGGRCGDVAMRLTASDTPPLAISLSGRFDRRPGTDSFTVRGELFRRTETGERFIGMVGNPGLQPQVMRRIFPYSDNWTRTGDGACSIEGKVS